LHGRLLDERLRLAVQVLRLRCRRVEHGPQQRCGCDELLAHSRGCVRVVDVKVSVNALVVLLAQLTRALAARGSFPSDGGAKQPYRDRGEMHRRLGRRIGQGAVAAQGDGAAVDEMLRHSEGGAGAAATHRWEGTQARQADIGSV
jgi:hypothetical protein